MTCFWTKSSKSVSVGKYSGDCMGIVGPLMAKFETYHSVRTNFKQSKGLNLTISHDFWKKGSAKTLLLGQHLSVLMQIFLTGTDDRPHGYWMSSRVLRVCLTDTDDGSSQVLRICLTGTDDLPHGYWISSRVLRVSLTDTDDVPHGHWISSQVLR